MSALGQGLDWNRINKSDQILSQFFQFIIIECLNMIFKNYLICFNKNKNMIYLEV